MIRMKEEYYDDIQKSLERYMFDTYYVPVIEILGINNKKLLNAGEAAVVSALRSRRIAYSNLKFSGSFSINISKELSKFATFDERSKTWNVKSQLDIPLHIRNTIFLVDSENKDTQRELEAFFDDLERSLEKNPEPIITPIRKTVDAMQDDLNKDLGTLGVKKELTDDEKNNLAQDYNKSQTLNIANWNPEQIERLRDFVSASFTEGASKQSLIDYLMSEMEVSRNKAKFLARQETSLFLSKFRRETSKSAGVNRYQWSASMDERTRERHQELNGKIFFYGDPPIVDIDTGRKAEPGEDFGCRCVAIPVM